jgi:hypothetical protein
MSWVRTRSALPDTMASVFRISSMVERDELRAIALGGNGLLKGFHLSCKMTRRDRALYSQYSRT